MPCYSAVTQLIIPSTEGCDWDAFPQMLAAVDSVCCFPTVEPPSQGGLPLGCLSAPPLLRAQNGSTDININQCSVECALRLLPLLNGTCGSLLHLLYDSADGERDGRAAVFDQAAEVCVPTYSWSAHSAHIFGFL